MDSGSLNERTLELLRNRPKWQTYETLTNACQLPSGWLDHYANGRIKHPPVDRVQCLYEMLSGVKLFA